ncbi:hypothetical protein BGZ54_007374 [Gamsiella multidivaricata]|nr:hypothetical protein BGZ54_007374 [Gamsiella multidivaricata]
MISDRRPRKVADNVALNGKPTKDGLTEYDSSVEDMDGSTDDYELHPSYQTLVNQEHDKYARPANWPSYINLLRAAFIYVLLQWTTLTELRRFAQDVWSQIEIGTSSQLTYLLIAILVHIQYTCLGQVVFMVERLFYPRLSPEEQREVSILNTVPRVFRRALQESLNSTLATVIVLSTLSFLGLLATILSVGVAHDVQGLVAQTHHRVTLFKQEQIRLTAQDGAAGDAGYAQSPKQYFVQQADEALVMAYDAGVSWFDPILKDAFPELSWGAVDWASHVANIIVEMDPSQGYEHAQDFRPQQQPDALVEVGTCKTAAQQEKDLGELMLEYQDGTAQSKFTKDATVLPKVPSDDVPSSSANSTEKKSTEQPLEQPAEEPELWVVPTLESFRFAVKNAKAMSGFQAQEQRRKKTAINISQGKRLLNIVLGYKVDTPTILWGFNAFNDLLFRWILFLLGLITFTGLKVSPLQRIGWIIDQALASSTSNYGSSRLSTSSSPGRAMAKSLEFAISGTFISMLKLSIYHTIFTLTWTRYLTDKVMALAATGAASSDFVPLKYAWLTSVFGIVLTLFPIAPNWLVSVPGAVVHFYVYGQRPMEAVAMVVGHVIFTSLIDGAVWDSHVVKSARPGVSSAFWLGLWVFLGGMKWGPKGLLLGPVFFAAVPAIWSALLELRGWPSSASSAKNRVAVRSESGSGSLSASATSVEEKTYVSRRGTQETRRRYRREEYVNRQSAH